jgi:hypothetical protein
MGEIFMKKTKQVLMTTSIIGLFLIAAGLLTSAEPIVEDITVSPEDPEPLSEVTFIATITSNESLDQVNIIVRECKKVEGQELCFVDSFNESMSSFENTYRTELTLKHDDATYIKYNLVIKSNGTWYEYDPIQLELSVETGNGDGTNGNGSNGDNGGNGDDGTPGFEIIPFLIAVVIGVLLFRRKRLR